MGIPLGKCSGTTITILGMKKNIESIIYLILHSDTDIIVGLNLNKASKRRYGCHITLYSV